MLLDAQDHTTAVMCLLPRLKYTTATSSAVSYFVDTHQNGSDFGEINDQKNENAGGAVKLIFHLDNIGVVFWKVDSNAHLGIAVPSSEAFLVESYSRGRILQLDATRRGLT